MRLSRLRTSLLGGAILVLIIVYAVPRITGRGGPASVLAAPAAAEPNETVRNKPLALARAQTALWAARAAAEQAWPENPFVVPPAQDLPGTPSVSNASAPRTTVAVKHVLKAIITGDTPRAVLNESVVAVGDVLWDGSVVLSIDAGSLTLRGPEGTTVLNIEH